MRGEVKTREQVSKFFLFLRKKKNKNKKALVALQPTFLKLASSTGNGGASDTSDPSACRMRGTLMVCGPAPYSRSRCAACWIIASTS